jgi:hypothetical protein
MTGRHTVVQSNLNVTAFRSAATRYHLRERPTERIRDRKRVPALVSPSRETSATIKSERAGEARGEKTEKRKSPGNACARCGTKEILLLDS